MPNTGLREELLGGVPPSNFLEAWFRRLSDSFFELNQSLVIWIAAGMIAAVAFVDFLVQSNFALGFLYLFPILLAAPRLGRAPAILLAILCAVLRETFFGELGWDEQSAYRLVSVLLGFSGVALFASEIGRNRTLVLQHLHQMRKQIELRKEAENQLRTLVETSPAAIVTLDATGTVMLANEAAHRLLGVRQGELAGKHFGRYLPMVNDILETSSDSGSYRTAATSRGVRENGEAFLASLWFASYGSGSARSLAAIITDASDDLRNMQESSLQSLLRSTRVLVGSVSHEIRNICAAIAMVHRNLGRLPGVTATEDYAALGTLSEGLARLATVELNTAGDADLELVNLNNLLEEFRIIFEPIAAASEIKCEWDFPENIPLVSGDHHGLIQVLLNLTRNSSRALAKTHDARIRVSAENTGRHVLIRVGDNGPGVSNPERLFQPFQPGADAVGLGLFVSRSIVRACGGELYHERSASGCVMCVKLTSDTATTSEEEDRAHVDLTV